jgi:hypothetical protein
MYDSGVSGSTPSGSTISSKDIDCVAAFLHIAQLVGLNATFALKLSFQFTPRMGKPAGHPFLSLLHFLEMKSMKQ